VVRVLIPPSPLRLRFAELFLCRHHYLASQGALAAASAVAIDEAGSVLPPPSTSAGTGSPGDAGPPLECDDLPIGDDHDYHLTFAVRIECTTCGHLMLFNAEKYRTGDEPILEREPAEEEGQLRQ
jgi:hypothetical protein